MSISQHEAVSLLNHTIFRPGWRVTAAPAAGDNILVGIEIDTVDTSFVTRGGEYKVSLTERALVQMSARDYGTPEALLFRTLVFIQGLEGHEDREFLRTWDPDAERWVAPFHSHNPEGQRAWDRVKAEPLTDVIRIRTGPDAPWVVPPVRSNSPCNEQIDDDDEGPQRLLADADCTLGPPERQMVLAHTHPGSSDPCTEDHGGCAEWGRKV